MVIKIWEVIKAYWMEDSLKISNLEQVIVFKKYDGTK